MPNATPDSSLLGIVKSLIELLSSDDRSRLRPWLLAKFDVSGFPARGFQERS